MRILRTVLAIIAIILVCFIGTTVYLMTGWSYDLPITVHSPHQVTATVHQTSGFSHMDDVTLTLDDGITQTVNVPFGKYSVSFEPDYSLLDDGVSVIIPQGDAKATASPVSQGNVDVTFETADISDAKSMADALNKVPGKYQGDAKPKYEELERQARLDKARNGVDTDQYTVTNIDVGDVKTGDVTVSFDLTNKTGRTMQWMEVDLDLMNDTGDIVGTARFSSDAFYRGQTSRVTAHGFTSQQVEYATVTNVVWY